MENIEQFVARWQNGETHPLDYYLANGIIHHGEQIQASWMDLEPYLKDKGFLVQDVQGVEQLGADMHFYGVTQENAPNADGEYHIFLPLEGDALLYVGTMFVCSKYRPMNALYCDMHNWKTEVLLH